MMQTYGGLDGGECLASCPSHYTPSTNYRKLGGPENQSGYSGKKQSPFSAPTRNWTPVIKSI